MSAGKFIPFLLPFKDASGQYITATAQATEILKKAQGLVAAGSPGVAIIYSANYGQTRDAKAAYAAGKATFQISGSNQATVMAAMESELNGTFASLQHKMEIACITTLNAYQNPLLPWDDAVWLGVLKDDFKNLTDLLNKGWDVLGWMNQDTVNTKSPYAIGGGIVQLPTNINDFIQSHLAALAKNFA
jgi:hypothetical protein